MSDTPGATSYVKMTAAAIVAQCDRMIEQIDREHVGECSRVVNEWLIILNTPRKFLWWTLKPHKVWTREELLKDFEEHDYRTLSYGRYESFEHAAFNNYHQKRRCLRLKQVARVTDGDVFVSVEDLMWMGFNEKSNGAV